MSEEYSGKTDRNVILRFLSGRLTGCEFHLAEEKNLIILGKARDLENTFDVATLPESVIFVPVQNASYNVEIIISEQNEVIVRELLVDEVREESVMFNTVFRTGDLFFALKENSQDWDSSILNFTEKARPETELTTKSQHTSLKRKGYYLLVIGICILGFTFLLISESERDNYQTFLKSIINDKACYQVVMGDDDRAYVWVRTDGDADRLNERLREESLSDKVKVLIPKKETSRIEKWLSENYRNIALYRARYEPPDRLQLRISKQRTTDNKVNEGLLQKNIKEYFPAIKNIEVIEVDDGDVISEADSGLKKLGLNFKQDVSLSYVAYHIYGQLDDSQLVKVKQFISSFYAKWGGGFIVFNVSLNNADNKGLSYGYGENSFIKTGPDNWSF